MHGTELPFHIDWPAAISRPDLEGDYDRYLVDASVVELLRGRLDLRLSPASDRNYLFVHKDFVCPHSRTPEIHFMGTDSVAVIGEKCALSGVILLGSGCVSAILGHQHALNLEVNLYFDDSFFWGQNSVTYGCRVWVYGRKRIVVGDDCLLSEGIEIRTSDHHSIIDLETRKQTNFPDDVTIDRHVWVGPHASIQKGVTIGKGSIIGSRSVVVGPVPEAELWAGVPAKRIRKNVSWVSTHPAADPDIDLMVSRYFPEFYS